LGGFGASIANTYTGFAGLALGILLLYSFLGFGGLGSLKGVNFFTFGL